jgi:sugar/nucleoside kinase (ribokinase family)
MKILVTGISCYEYGFYVDEWIDKDREYFLGKTFRRPGGAALNVATYASHTCGLDIELLSCFGEDGFGKLVSTHLLAHKVKINSHSKRTLTTPVIITILNVEGNRTFLLDLSKNLLDSTVSHPLEMANYEIVYIAPMPSLNSTETIINRSIQTGTKIIFNPGSSLFGVRKTDWLNLFHSVDTLILNEMEAMKYSGQDVNNSLGFFHKILKGCVVVTLGKKGAIAWEREASNPTYVPGLCVTVNRTVGAGDAFSAGYIFGLVHGMGLQARVESGVAVASLAVQQIGDQIPQNQAFSSLLAGIQSHHSKTVMGERITFYESIS